MKLKQNLLIVGIFSYQLILRICAQCQSSVTQLVSNSSANTRFNFPFLTYHTMGREFCIKECIEYLSCVSINFQKTQLRCELVSFSSAVNSAFLLEDFGIEHIVINRTKDSSSPLGMSKDTVLGKCNENFYKCVSTKSGQRRCLQTGNRLSFTNMARDKPVEYSSVWNDDLPTYNPQRLTDGDRRAIHSHCAATKKEIQPWFRIDLQSVLQVDHVLVYTGWYYGAPCNAYQIRVGKSATWSEMTSCGEGSQAKNETIVCKDCLLGRYVQLQMKAKDANCHIVICELEVIASAV